MTPETDPLDLLRDHGLRATAQRIRIMEAVLAGPGHPTAEEVWERARRDQPTLSLSTVYETLSRFVELGLIDELHVGEATRYEFADAPHVNVVCSECGAVEDVDVNGLAAVLEEAGDRSRFEVPPQPLEAQGRCNECRD